jgi:uncharacterized protein YqeY
MAIISRRGLAMSEGGIKDRLKADLKSAMKNKEKERLAAVRAIKAAISQVEVDERIECDDERAISIVDKVLKLKKESIQSFKDAGRTEQLVEEEAECRWIEEYLPAQLSSEEVSAVIEEAIAEVKPESIKDMGKVMAVLRPKLLGKADMSSVGPMIKARLSK